MGKKNRSIYLIDGHALCYRAYYAIQDLKTSKGMPTNAIYGFLNIFRKLLRQYNPEMMAVVFDMKGPTARHKEYEKYKIHRKPMPDDLAGQIPRIKDVINAYNIPICQMEGYEADDIIATLSEKAKKNGLDVIVVTSDKDALQLIDEKITILSPHSMGDKMYGSDEVKQRYGVEPRLMTEVMALTGDASDNIPGVKGIGPVTASKLINRFNSVEKIYANIDEISSKQVREKLVNGRDMAELSRKLVELNRDVPISLDFDKTQLAEPDLDRLAGLFKEFEFEKLLYEIMPCVAKDSKYVTVKSEKEVTEAIKKITKHKTASISVLAGSGKEETASLAFSWDKAQACFVSLQRAAKSPHQGIMRLVKDLIENETIQKIGYDIKNDMLTLRDFGIEVKGRVFDIMIADYCLDPSLSKHTLEGITMRYLGYSLQEEKTDKPPVLYACQRSDTIFQLYEKLEPELKEKCLASLFWDVEIPLVSILADMENEGVSVDIEYLKKQSIVMEEKLKCISKKIYEIAGEEFNINSPKQLQVILYDKLHLPATKRTKTGISTDESVLQKLASVHQLPRILLEYRQINKLKSGYYDSMLELVDTKTCKLHTHFNQAVTATGRLSSSEPNLQNIPIKTTLGRQIRRAFVPCSKERLLLTVDYSQIELRVLAHLSEDKKLVEAFKKGEDVHLSTASQIFGCPINELTSQMRQTAKTVNFGVVYGMSAFGLAKDLGIDIAEAQKFITFYFDKYSGVKIFIDQTIREARKTGVSATLLKRKRFISEINSTNDRLKGFAERVAVNTPVQGSAADIIKLAMIKCHEKFKGTDVKMIIQVHDELVFDIPKDRLKTVAGEIKDIMESVIKLKVPLKVDIEAGKNWLDMEPVEV